MTTQASPATDRNCPYGVSVAFPTTIRTAVAAVPGFIVLATSRAFLEV